MKPSDKVKVREALAAFNRGYSATLNEADRRKVNLAKRLARELEAAKTARERREAKARYEEKLRRMDAAYKSTEDEGRTKPMAGDESEGDYHTDKAPGPKARFGEDEDEDEGVNDDCDDDDQDEDDE